MRVNLAATKTNLLKVKKTLSLTKEGYDLLDEKRRILLSELAALIDTVDQAQSELDKALRQAYDLLDKVVVGMGRKRIEELSLSIDIKNDFSLSHRRIMGVTIPVIDLNVVENPPYYSSYEVNLQMDEAISRFKECIKLMARLAEKKISLIRLADETRKTIRKVKALEKIYIPHYSDALKFISERLDEEARDSFALLKLIKKRI